MTTTIHAHKSPTPEPVDEPIPEREPEPEDDPVPHPDPVMRLPASGPDTPAPAASLLASALRLDPRLPFRC